MTIRRLLQLLGLPDDASSARRLRDRLRYHGAPYSLEGVKRVAPELIEQSEVKKHSREAQLALKTFVSTANDRFTDLEKRVAALESVERARKSP